eukprot:COSAG01_NODE_2230_length_8125_cov_9.414652_10_plen_75_part_00
MSFTIKHDAPPSGSAALGAIHQRPPKTQNSIGSSVRTCLLHQAPGTPLQGAGDDGGWAVTRSYICIIIISSSQQ